MYKESLDLCEKANKRFNEDVLVFWKAYCYFKLDDKNQSLLVLKEIEGKGEVDLCIDRLKNIIEKNKRENNESLKWVNKGDFILSHLLFLEIFEGNWKETREILRKTKISHYLCELAKALLEMAQRDFLCKDSVIRKVKESLDRAVDLRPENPYALLLMV